MEIVIIGAGNVADYFGRKLKDAGFNILQVLSRDIEHAKKLSEILDAEAINDINNLNTNADLYLLAVNDTALSQLNGVLTLNNKLVLHTSGAMPLNIINKISNHTGVLYPLQTIKKDIPNIHPVPLLLEASSTNAMDKLLMIANAIADNYTIMASEQRLKLHLAAVFSNNFINHLAALTEEYCKVENINYSLLKPLLAETTSHFKKGKAVEWQTGPAKRNDMNTIHIHQALLKEMPELLNIYNVLSESIRKYYNS